METLFENKCVLTKKNLLEMVKKTQAKSLIVINYIAVVLCALNGASHLVHQDYISAVLLLSASAVIGCFYFYIPYITVKKMLKRDYEMYHTEAETTALFYDDHLLSIHEQNTGKINVDYTQIIKVKRTKGLYLLMMRENLVILIDKNGFIKGDRQAFEAFIKEKATKAKIRL